MQYPLPNWKTRRRGYGFGVKTSYSDFHLGVDVFGIYGERIKAPTQGSVVAILRGEQGGLTIWFKMDNGKLMRFLHLKRTSVAVGQRCTEGQDIAEMGNTGLVSPKPTTQNPTAGTHLHIDVSKDGKLRLWDRNNFENPDVTLQDADHYPVDDAYGQKRVWTLEQKFAWWWIPGSPAAYIKSKIGRGANNREVKALAYGRWDFDAVYRNRVGNQWLHQVKP